MVASPTAQLSIIKRNKFPVPPPMIRYQALKRSLVAFLCDLSRNPAQLQAELDELISIRDDHSRGLLVRDDAGLSVDALRAFTAANNELDLGKFQFHPAPARPKPLVLSGVKVNVQPDVLIRKEIKNVDHVGGAILRLAKTGKNEPDKARREEMGRCVAELIFRQVQERQFGGLSAHASMCMAIDVQQNRKYVARAGSRRMNDMESACTMIAALWPNIER